jgi:predicted membrane protein
MRNEPINKEEAQEHRSPAGKITAGLLILLIGVILFAKQAGAEFPEWLFTWPLYIIIGGFILGALNNFRGITWAIIMVIGGLFWLERLVPDLNIRHFFWPILIITLGLMIILTALRKKKVNNNSKTFPSEPISADDSTVLEDDYISGTILFGSENKNIISKDFKGGDLTCFFGGATLNLTKSDFLGKPEIRIAQLFGKTKLIIPPQWRVISETSIIFGGVSDNRNTAEVNDSKLIIVKGTCIFGEVIIESY